MTVENFLKEYNCSDGIWDEMCNKKQVREPYAKVFRALQNLQISDLHLKDRLAGELFMNQGITFTVYSDNAGIERIFPLILFHELLQAKNGII